VRYCCTRANYQVSSQDMQTHKSVALQLISN
jgi:hypothetical protein